MVSTPSVACMWDIGYCRLPFESENLLSLISRLIIHEHQWTKLKHHHKYTPLHGCNIMTCLNIFVVHTHDYSEMLTTLVMPTTKKFDPRGELAGPFSHSHLKTPAGATYLICFMLLLGFHVQYLQLITCVVVFTL